MTPSQERPLAGPQRRPQGRSSPHKGRQTGSTEELPVKQGIEKFV